MTDPDEPPVIPQTEAPIRHDAELEGRIADIERRAQEARSRHRAAADREGAPDRMTPEGARGLALGLTIAYAILGLPMFGFVVGWVVDRQLDSQFWAGALTLVGAIGGIVFAFFAVQRGERRP
jgi:F0F1-type ATP synthase assembly protein I